MQGKKSEACLVGPMACLVRKALACKLASACLLHFPRTCFRVPVLTTGRSYVPYELAKGPKLAVWKSALRSVQIRNSYAATLVS